MRLELTRRGDYAVRAMLALAQVPPTDGLLSARRIAARMGIPAAFLPQVMRDLMAVGLVAATTGRSGGYRLARPASEISVLEVIESVEGDGRRIACVLRGSPCGSDGFCDAHSVFFAAQEAMLDRLRVATLAELGQHGGSTTLNTD
jgi:Rrf2 family protein